MSVNVKTYKKPRLQKELVKSVLTNSVISYYSPPKRTTTIIGVGQLVIVNTSNKDRWFSLWVDNDGSSTTDSEIVVFELDIDKNSFWTNTFEIIMNDIDGNLSVEAEKNNELTLTINGVEISNT